MNKRRRGLVASIKGIEIANQQLKSRSLSKLNLSKEVERSIDTIHCFFRRRYIERLSFIKICEALNIEWETIVDTEDFAEWTISNSVKDNFSNVLSASQAVIWQPGQKLYGDRYTIIKAQQDRTELASGGFGITYLARDNQGREVVIKTLNERAQTSPKFAKIQQDFRDEATRLGYCKHPHIVQIENKFDVGQLPCIVLEYIKGETLWNRVDNHGNPVALSEEEALLYIRQVGEALIVVHGKGLLHRDVSPHNIILRADRSEVVLIDFGISKEYIPDLMQQYTVAFTECFSPLEQYDDNGKYGNFSDVYALAATMFYLVTGKSPTPVRNRVFNDEFIPQKLDTLNISNNVKNAVLEGMAVNAKNRSKSVNEWLGLLEGLDNKNKKIVKLPRRINLEMAQLFFSVLSLLATLLVFIFTVSSSWTSKTDVSYVKVEDQYVKVEDKDGSYLMPTDIKHSSPTLQTTFKCVAHQENWAVIAQRGNAISSSPIITFNSTEFGGASTPQERCSTVAQRLTNIVANNGGKLGNLNLTTGKVGGSTVVCLVNSQQKTCDTINMLFSLNSRYADNPSRAMIIIFDLNSSGFLSGSGNNQEFIPLEKVVIR